MSDASTQQRPAIPDSPPLLDVLLPSAPVTSEEEAHADVGRVLADAREAVAMVQREEVAKRQAIAEERDRVSACISATAQEALEREEQEHARRIQQVEEATRALKERSGNMTPEEFKEHVRKLGESTEQ